MKQAYVLSFLDDKICALEEPFTIKYYYHNFIN